jgi:hypothetical protein
MIGIALNGLIEYRQQVESFDPLTVLFNRAGALRHCARLRDEDSHASWSGADAA